MPCLYRARVEPRHMPTLDLLSCQCRPCLRSSGVSTGPDFTHNSVSTRVAVRRCAAPPSLSSADSPRALRPPPSQSRCVPPNCTLSKGFRAAVGLQWRLPFQRAMPLADEVCKNARIAGFLNTQLGRLIREPSPRLYLKLRM